MPYGRFLVTASLLISGFYCIYLCLRAGVPKVDGSSWNIWFAYFFLLRVVPWGSAVTTNGKDKDFLFTKELPL
jgi:hypothetical protein